MGGYTNVEFRKGDIESRIPVHDNTADLVISNCVINLTIDKAVCVQRDLQNSEKQWWTPFPLSVVSSLLGFTRSIFIASSLTFG